MTATNTSVDRVLAALNPVPADPRPFGLDEQARADLAEILATDRQPIGHLDTRGSRRGRRTTRRRGWQPAAAFVAAAVVALVALIALVAVPGLRGGVAYAATPQPLTYQPTGEDAATLLRQIAAHTAALPDDTGTGRYSRIDTRAWSLSTRIDGQQVTSTVVPEQTTRWVAADGSGRVITTATLPGGQHVHHDQMLGAGGSALMWPLRSLSPDDATLARQLADGHPAANGPAERFIAVQDAALQMPMRPAVRAALLRYLAATPGITNSGTTVDRDGRAGLAVSVDSAYSGLPTRYTLVIDPATGRLLDAEQTLTTTSGRLNVPVPSVIGYTLLLDARYVATTR